MHPILRTALAVALLGTSLISQDRLLYSVGAPVPGNSTTVRLTNPAASSGNAYVLAVSAHTDATSSIPGFTGTFRLDATTLTVLAGGTLAATPTDHTYALPGSSTLIGLMADFQFVEGTGTASILSDNELVVTVVNGVGTSLIGVGSTGNTLGWSLQNVKDATVGNPSKINTTNWDREPMRGGSVLGYATGFFGQNGFTDRHAGPYVFKRDRPVKDMLDGTFGGWANQHGKRVRMMRNTSKTNEFFLVLIDDATSTVAQIPGSVLENASTTGSTSNPYGDYWFLTPDGLVACGVGDFAKGGDIMVMARLDGKTWNAATGSTQTGSNTSVLRLSTAAGALYDQNTYIGNEVLIQGGQASSSNGGSSRRSMWWAPLDGSAAPKEVVIPALGGTRGNPNRIPGSVWRATRDLKTIVFVSYLTGNTNADVYSITNIGKAGITVKNISKFPTVTELELWQNERSAESTFSGAISADGTYCAFLSGQGGSTAPNQLWVAPTDGSKAGSLKAIGGFPTGTTWLGGLQFLPPQSGRRPMVVTAGTDPAKFDMYYIIDAAAASPVVIRMTNTSNDINYRWSYESDNGRYLYWCRESATTTNFARNIVGIDMNASPAKLFDVTGSEFSSGTAPSLELDGTLYNNYMYLAPNNSNEMYFVGRPVRKVSGSTTTYFDANVFKFNFESGGTATRVTNYTGSATDLDDVVHIGDMQPLSDGSVVYAASTGAPSTAAKNKATVHWHKGDGSSTPLNLGQHAVGSYVSPGTINVVESTGRVYWVQMNSLSSTTPAGNVACMAFLNNLTKGHPVYLSGLPINGAGSRGNVLNITNSK